MLTGRDPVPVAHRDNNLAATGDRSLKRATGPRVGVATTSYLGRLLEAEQPHSASYDRAKKELDKRASDRERVRLEHLLVPNVEEDVGRVP